MLAWLNKIDTDERLAHPQLALLHLSALIFSRHFSEAHYQLQSLKHHYGEQIATPITDTLLFLENVFNLFHQDYYQPDSAILQAQNKQHHDDVRDSA